jgi:hypothetical protein
MLRFYSFVAVFMMLFFSACTGIKGDYGYGPNSSSVVVGPTPSIYLKSGEIDLWNKTDNSKQMVANALSKCAGLSNCMIQVGFVLTNDLNVLKQHASKICFNRHYQSTRPSLDFCLQTKEMQAFILDDDNPNNEKNRWVRNDVSSREKGIDFAVCTLWQAQKSNQEKYGETAEDQRINCLLEKGYTFKGKVVGYNQGMGDEAKCYSIWFYLRFNEYCESPQNPVRPKGGFKSWHMLYGTCRKYPQKDVCQLLDQMPTSRVTGENNSSHKPESKSYCWFGCGGNFTPLDPSIEKVRQLREDMQKQNDRQMKDLLRSTKP